MYEMQNNVILTFAPARTNISATAMLPAPTASWRGVKLSPTVRLALAPYSSRVAAA